MIYLIFTSEGFAEAKDNIIEDQAGLWINDNILSASQLTELETQNIPVTILNSQVKPSDEKAIITIVEKIEELAKSNIEILVEYS